MVFCHAIQPAASSPIAGCRREDDAQGQYKYLTVTHTQLASERTLCVGHKNRSTGAESGLCCVSYGVSAVFLWHAHRNRIKALTGGMDNGRLGHLQATCDGADRRHGDLLLVRGGTRCGSVRAAKRIKLSKLKTIKNLVYHFHIPPYQTTAEINQKVVYTTFRPVNGQHWPAPVPRRAWPHPHRFVTSSSR